VIADDEGMTRRNYDCSMILTTTLLACLGLASSTGCGSSQATPGSGKQVSAVLQLTPSAVNVSVGASVSFHPLSEENAVPNANCVWSAADPTVLASKGNGDFAAMAPGSSAVTATCGGSTASASVLVATVSNPSAIKITSGGVYSGNWSSKDPSVPAVTIITSEPVTIKNSTVSGPGQLIVIYGSGRGGDVTIDNVTGTAIDPGVAAQAKGKFIDAEVMSRLSVTHCTMHKVSFGVYIVSSTLTSLTIKDNVADNLDDRNSDGNGGYLINQRTLGHFIQFNGVSLPNGGEIGWNKVINTDEAASTEDILSFYESHASADKMVLVHDNYLEGAFAAGQTTTYTGGGMQFDGGSSDPSTATGFIKVYDNTLVHTAGFGISIGAGHDISVTSNRIVSCGKDRAGKWIADPGSFAISMWNYYQTNQFFNNYMANNSGGLVRPGANGNPSPGDISAPSASDSLHNIVGTNVFEQPCLTSSGLTLAAESAERTRWLDTVSQAGELLGDQH
jgi:hypothetical protein